MAGAGAGRTDGLALVGGMAESAGRMTGSADQMQFTSLDDFLMRSGTALAKGPVALIFVEDDAEIGSTVAHCRKIGFAQVLLFAPRQIAVPEAAADLAHVIAHEVLEPGAVPLAVNRVIAAAPATTWFYYGYNAEYLMFPFCESRRIGEMLDFHAEERRAAMLTIVIDLYAPDFGQFPDAVSLGEAMLDRSGYYALARFSREGVALERQMDFFGGVRWRFEEHIPWARRRIDRVSLFRPQKGLQLRADHTFSVEEYNTISCPWHHNLTAAVASFRTAKALKTNPGSKWAIPSFLWQGSVKFDWSSRQLMELGLMEPGQWF